MSPDGNSTRFLNGLTRRVLFLLLILTSCSPAAFPAIVLDPAFGTGGKVTVEFPDATTAYRSWGQRIFVQPNGRIVAVGVFQNWGPDGYAPGVGMAGLTPGGAIDPAFGSAGTVRDWHPVAFTGLSDSHVYSDGKILRISQFFPIFAFPEARVLRTNADGSADGAFSANINVSPANTIPLRMSVRSDGKIVILVFAQTLPESHHLFRLNPDGSRDASFGINGDKLMDLRRTPDPWVVRLLTLPDGKILLAGHLGPYRSAQDYNEFFIAKFNADGFHDHSFGSQGVVRFTYPSGLKGFASNMILQPDGKILITGGIKNPDNTILVRFTSRGKVDNFFGSAGVVVSDLAPGNTDSAAAAVLSSDGKIRIAGMAGSPSGFLLARYSPSGILEDQIVTAFTPGQNSAASDVIFQPDGKILAIGFTKNPNPAINGDVFAVARYTEGSARSKK